MEKYLDYAGEGLRIGSYIDLNSKRLFYFNGYYDKDGIPQFEDGERGGIIKGLYHKDIKKLVRASLLDLTNEKIALIVKWDGLRRY